MPRSLWIFNYSDPMCRALQRPLSVHKDLCKIFKDLQMFSRVIKRSLCGRQWSGLVRDKLLLMISLETISSFRYIFGNFIGHDLCNYDCNMWEKKTKFGKDVESYSCHYLYVNFLILLSLKTKSSRQSFFFSFRPFHLHWFGRTI